MAKPKKITINKNSKCDLCSKPMKYMGANKETMKIHKACEEHKDEVAKALKNENN